MIAGCFMQQYLSKDLLPPLFGEFGEEFMVILTEAEWVCLGYETLAMLGDWLLVVVRRGTSGYHTGSECIECRQMSCRKAVGGR